MSEQKLTEWYPADVKPPLTDWFDADVKPVHAGVYEREAPPKYQYPKWPKWLQFWDGEKWLFGGDTPELTAQRAAATVRIEDPNPRRWRGLAVQP